MNDGLPEKTPEIIYPDQYPKNLEDTSPIVPRGRPVRYLTPKREIVELKMMPHNDAIIRKIYNDKW